MFKAVNQFFISDNKIHTVKSAACVLPPPKNHVYEVFRVISSVPLFIKDHIERLEQSLAAHNIIVERAEIYKNIKTLLQLNQFVDGNIRISYWKTEFNTHSMFSYDLHSYPDKQMFEEGIELGIIYKERENPNVKFFDSEMREIAKESIDEHNFYEVILITQDNRITECSRSNIFFIKEKKVISPPSDQVLEGVTRKKIIEIIREEKIEFEERTIYINELEDFDSCFISGTSKRVLPANKIASISIPYNCDNEVLRFLQKKFWEKCVEYIKKNQNLENLS